MRLAAPVLIGLALTVVLASTAHASNPIPGVGIVVKRNPGSSTALTVPADFFGAGSSAFSGTVGLEGRCSNECGGCDNCASSPLGSDTRIDFDLPPGSSVLSATMPYFVCYSVNTVDFTIGGAVRPLQVVVSVSGRAPAPALDVSGEFVLPAGTTLAVGSSAELVSGSLQVRCVTTFVDATTGQAVGGSLVRDLDVSLSSLQPVAISRVDNGTTAGRVVLGRDGSGAVTPVRLASSGDELVLSLLSLDTPVTPVRASGLACVATGASSLSSSDGRRLVVSNIGSSGQDGVDVSLHGLQGHVVSSVDLCPSAPGATTELRTGGAIAGIVVGVVVALQRSPLGGIDVSCDLSRLHSSSSSASRQNLLYLAGGLERSVSSSAASPLSFSVSSSSGPVSVTRASCEVLPQFDVAVVTLWLSSGALVTLDGQTTACDRIVLVEDCDDGDAVLESFSLRCTMPPSSPPFALELSSQSVVSHGTQLSVGDLDMDGLSDFVALSTVSNAAGSRGIVTTSRAPSAEVLDLAGGGGSGGALARGPRQTVSLDGSFSSVQFSPLSPFVLNPATDAGASLECRVLSDQSCSPDQVLASLSLSALSSSSSSLRLSGQFSGMCADGASIQVLHRGAPQLAVPLQVALSDLSVNGISVSAPPGALAAAAVLSGGKTATKSSSNIQNNLVIGAPSVSTVLGSDGVPLQFTFASPRVFCINGQCLTGDRIVVTGQCSSGACQSSGFPITIRGSDFAFTGKFASPGAKAPAGYARFANHLSDQVIAQVTPGTSLTPTRPVVHIPVLFDRSDVHAARGTTVTFHLSSNLVLANPVVEGDYFSRSGQTQQFVTTNPDGSYTVDCALLGPGCGPTDSGTLFVVDVARAPGAPDGVGSLTIDASEAAACDGSALPANPGNSVFVLLDNQSPTAITDLTATQVKSGNDADGTTRVSLVWSPRSNMDETVEIYRASFGNYPLFSRGASAGSVPPPPSSYPPTGRFASASSSLVLSCDATGSCAVFDEPSSRDEFYYVAVVRDGAGNTSPFSNMTDGTLDFHLGDVAGGAAGTLCDGDNQVSSIDISALGAHYGSTVSTSSSFACLDVGPTFDGTVDGRPVPDGRLSFRDLILYAINYSLVSMPASRPALAREPANTLSLGVPALPEPGRTFEVNVDMTGAGDALGVSAQLAWDAAVVEPVGVSSGVLADQQGRQAVVLSAEPGNVDAALLGVGSGFAGRGTLARVTFRVKSAGDPAIRIASVEGRDMQAQPVAFSGFEAPSPGGRTALRLAYPNPFAQQTTVVFALAKAGEAHVGVYDVTGRQVRTLLQGVQPAGERLVQWDGRDDRGHALGAGVYMLRLQAGGRVETRAVRLVK